MMHVELVMRRRNVWAFIQADPVHISIVRPGPLVKTAAGGWVRGPDLPPLAPQTARIVHNYRRFNHGIVNSEAGNIIDAEYLLIAPHTMNLQKDDKFTWLGGHYTVTAIHPFRTESTLATLDFDGADNG